MEGDKASLMKRTILAIVVSLFLGAVTFDQAFSATASHKVRSGDNLHTIAKKYRIPVSKLKDLNNLKSNKLKPGQTLVVKKNTPSRSTRKSQPEIVATPTENDGEFIEYRTKRRDTLDKVARQFNVDKEDILELNTITRKRLPRVILIPKNTMPKVAEVEEEEDIVVTLPTKNLKPWRSNDEKYMLVKVAKSFVGAPYQYGGETVRGLDCSAFVKKIYEIFDVQLPRSAREQYRVGNRVSKEELSIGDLVFFQTKRSAGYPTHVGIYIGDGNFIHSSSGHNRLGVKVDALSSDFYSRTYMGATRVKKSPEGNTENVKNPEKASSNS
ncbi:MAG: D-gamma-glutamyl-meso-diaminopimelic acid endopeptidase CwlS precursor [Syntrophorhabdus sp. PtaU1.Bin153]|nr:MAG: D-gamma-glutamyl-meso-diaminopimelic acid endopeptidase CwlS precursor [Syntrophorhabdus sp. PtaU1.Bin153]